VGNAPGKMRYTIHETIAITTNYKDMVHTLRRRTWHSVFIMCCIHLVVSSVFSCDFREALLLIFNDVAVSFDTYIHI